MVADKLAMIADYGDSRSFSRKLDNTYMEKLTVAFILLTYVGTNKNVIYSENMYIVITMLFIVSLK